MSGRPSYEELENRIKSLENENTECQKALSYYQNFFHLANDAIVIHDPNDGRVLDVNEKMLEMYGYTREEALQLDVEAVSDGSPPYTQGKASELVRIAANGKPQLFEWKSKRKNGEIFWVEVSLRIASMGDKEHVIAIVRDVSIRKRAEEALRESERVMRYIIKHDPNALAVFDTELRYIAASDRYLNDYDVAEADIIGKYHYEVFPEMPQRWKEVHQRVLAGTSVRNDDDSFERPDGSITYNRWECRPWYRTDGSIGGMITYTEVTTEHKLAEESLRKSEKRFATAFQHSPAPLVLSEIDTGLFIDVNERWVEMLEFSREESIGRTSKEVGIWDDPGDRDRIISILRSSGRLRDEPIRFKTKSGRTVIALWSAETVDLSGKQAMLSMITDITQLRQAEEERERLGAQLQQAQKMESVGRLAGGVAHDFNNMLNVILGRAEIMSDDLPADSPLRDDLDQIRTAAERSANLTRQLLAFARKQTIAPKDLDLNDTIAPMLKMLQRLIGEDIDLLWQPGAPLDTVRIDPGQVDQMLANLAVNARDAIGHAHGKITIETANARLDKDYCADHAGFIPGNYVMLVFSDDGCGMDAETRTSIFEPFFTTKGVGEGTGLGLATVYGIVKQNDGFVNVYSEPGQGTTFRIYLPALAEASARPTGAEAGPDSPDTGDETILVVEDQPALLSLIRTMLERLGYTVLTAGTPGEAIQLAQEHTGEIQLLVTDVVMPEMNGRDLARNIFSIHPNLKRLFMSGYTANVIAHHGVLDEGVNFIEKPFSLAQLGAKVREALGSGEA